MQLANGPRSNALGRLGALRHRARVQIRGVRRYRATLVSASAAPSEPCITDVGPINKATIVMNDTLYTYLLQHTRESPVRARVTTTWKTRFCWRSAVVDFLS